MPQLLIVEDQKKLLSSLQRGLEEKGYEVITATTGEQGYYAATTEPIDAMILDLMLPGRDGIRVLRDLRGKGFTRPVLILTARDAIEDKVLGLDSGADDYLVKPFAFAELLARLRALLRRDVSGRELVLRADDLEVDLLARRVVRDGIELDLTKREYELLEYLLRHKNSVVTREMISPRRVEGSHRSPHQRHRRLRDASPQEGRATGFSAAHPHLARRGLLAKGWLMGILSIRWRLTLWYGAVLALVLSIFGGAVYLMMRHALTERAGAGLLMESAEVEQEIARAKSAELLSSWLERRFAHHPGFDIQVTTPQGEKVFRSERIRDAGLPVSSSPPAPGQTLFVDCNLDRGRFHISNRGSRWTEWSPGGPGRRTT